MSQRNLSRRSSNASTALPPLGQSLHRPAAEFTLLGSHIQGPVAATSSQCESELVAARQQIASLKFALETEKGRNDACRRTISDLNAQIAKLSQPQNKPRPKSSISGPPMSSSTMPATVTGNQKDLDQIKGLMDDVAQRDVRIAQLEADLRSEKHELEMLRSKGETEANEHQANMHQLQLDLRQLRDQLIAKTEELLAINQEQQQLRDVTLSQKTVTDATTQADAPEQAKSLADVERASFENRLERLHRQMVQAVGESLGLKEELRHEKARKKEMEIQVEHFRKEILEMQETLSFLQQQLIKMSQSEVSKCKRCDQLTGQIEQYRSALKEITDSVDAREQDLERRDKAGIW